MYTETVDRSDIGALTWKERRLEVFGGGLRWRVEALQRQQVVCEVMTRRRFGRRHGAGHRPATDAAARQLLKHPRAVVEWSRAKPDR